MEGDREIGLARVITDCVTYAYLCAVDIEKGRRGQGLGSEPKPFSRLRMLARERSQSAWSPEVTAKIT
jgi:hypothetical protein